MTIKLTESWAAYGSNSDISTYAANFWDVINAPWTWGATSGPRSTPGMAAATTGSGALALGRSVIAGGASLSANNADPMCIAFEVKISATPAALTSFIQPYQSGIVAGSTYNTFRINTSGQLAMYFQDGSLIATGSTNICDNARHWICLVFTYGNSTGIQKCWVDGVSQWSNPGALGNSGGINSFAFISIASRTINLGNVYVFNTGGTVYNDTAMPLSDRQLLVKFPDGDNSVQFSHSTGATNFGVVDEQPLSIADYVESSTIGHKDYLDYAALGVTPASIHSVHTKTLVGNSVSGVVSIRQNAKASGGTASNGTTLVCPGTPRFITDTFLTEPGGAAWTEAKVNGASFGYEFIS